MQSEKNRVPISPLSNPLGNCGEPNTQINAPKYDNGFLRSEVEKYLCDDPKMHSVYQYRELGREAAAQKQWAKAERYFSKAANKLIKGIGLTLFRKRVPDFIIDIGLGSELYEATVESGWVVNH